MKVTKVLIVTEDGDWIGCHADGGVDTGFMDDEGARVQSIGLSNLEILAAGLEACDVITNATRKLIGDK